MWSELPELITWRRGRSLSYGEGIAFWALGEMVKAQAGILESDSADVAQQKLTEAVAAVTLDERDRVWLARHLRPLVGLDAAPSGGDGGRVEAFAAWRRFVEALAEQGPTVLVFEDIHWADDGAAGFHRPGRRSRRCRTVVDRMHSTARAPRAAARLGRRQDERNDDLAHAALRRRHRAAGRRPARPGSASRRGATAAARPGGG